MSMPKAGKTSLSFDIELTGPLEELQNFENLSSLDDLPPFNFDLKKLNLATDFGHYTHSGSFSFNKVNSSDRNFVFNSLSTTQTSKAEFERFKEQWGTFLDNLPVCQQHAESGVVNDACPLVKSLIPKMDEFGKIIGEVDLKVTITNPEDILDSTKAVLNAFNYYSEIYGFKSGGNFDFRNKAPSDGTYKFELLNYKLLFQDLFHYLTKVETIFPLFNVRVEQFPRPSAENLNHILNFVKDVSDDPRADGKDVTITFKIHGADVKVGTLNYGQFLQKASALTQELSKDLIKKPEEVEEVK
jgi:hypothetical protein